MSWLDTLEERKTAKKMLGEIAQFQEIVRSWKVSDSQFVSDKRECLCSLVGLLEAAENIVRTDDFPGVYDAEYIHKYGSAEPRKRGDCNSILTVLTAGLLSNSKDYEIREALRERYIYTYRTPEVQFLLSLWEQAATPCRSGVFGDAYGNKYLRPAAIKKAISNGVYEYLAVAASILEQGLIPYGSKDGYTDYLIMAICEYSYHWVQIYKERYGKCYGGNCLSMEAWLCIDTLAYYLIKCDELDVGFEEDYYRVGVEAVSSGVPVEDVFA